MLTTMLVNFQRYNFDTWWVAQNPAVFRSRLRTIRDQWAKTGSANQDIKIYIGALAGPDGTGYVDAGTLASHVEHAQETCTRFGGVALWDATLAVGLYTRMYGQFVRLLTSCLTANDNYHEAVKSTLTSRGEAQYRVTSRFSRKGS